MIKITNNGHDSSPPEIKLLVFDLGGVVVSYEWDIVCKGFAQIAGISVDSFREKLKQVYQHSYEKGHIGTDDIVKHLNNALNLQLTNEQFELLWTATFDEDMQMAELLQDLRKQMPLYLLSNTNDVHYRYIEDNFNISRHFQELILSYEVGWIKPEPEIYHEILKRSGMKANQCLFIDDLEPNIKGAQAVGLHAHQFIGIDDLRQKLHAFGIKIS